MLCKAVFTFMHIISCYQWALQKSVCLSSFTPSLQMFRTFLSLFPSRLNSPSSLSFSSEMFQSLSCLCGSVLDSLHISCTGKPRKNSRATAQDSKACPEKTDAQKASSSVLHHQTLAFSSGPHLAWSFLCSLVLAEICSPAVHNTHQIQVQAGLGFLTRLNGSSIVLLGHSHPTSSSGTCSYVCVHSGLCLFLCVTPPSFPLQKLSYLTLTLGSSLHSFSA